MNQSELKANACIRPSAGNVWEQGRIGSFSTPDGLKNGANFSDLPQSVEKTEINCFVNHNKHRHSVKTVHTFVRRSAQTCRLVFLSR